MHVSEGAYARLGKARTARLPARSNPASRCHETCGHHSTVGAGLVPTSLDHVLSFHTEFPGPDQGRQGSGSSESSPPLRGPHQLRMLRTAAVAAVRACDGVASVAPLHEVVCVRPGIRACVRACVRSISVPAACDPVAVLLSSSRTV